MIGYQNEICLKRCKLVWWDVTTGSPFLPQEKLKCGQITPLPGSWAWWCSCRNASNNNSCLTLSWLVMEFRTYSSKIWHLSILNVLSWRSLREQQKQEGHFAFPLPLLPWIRSEKLHVRGALSLLEKEHPYL